ncbi:MAG TPA: S8/S53 family peptidase [Chloroflexota bacterium]|jgi:hypothetical protein
MDQPTPDANEREVVNFVPDEVCVVVAADGIADGAAFYEHVRTRLNSRIVQLVRAAYQPPGRGKQTPASAFELDLTPRLLAQRFAQTEEPLQPLVRPGVEPRDLSPFLALRRESPARTSWHLYYQLGSDRISLDSKFLAQRRVRIDCIRELTLLLNVRLRGVQVDRFRRQAWTVVATTPNWLTAALPFSCGSPAGLPIAATPKPPPTFTFPDQLLAAALNAPQRGKVIVAVLDTCPRQDDVDKAAARFASNPLLREVQQSVRMNQPALVPDQHFVALEPSQPRLQWDMANAPHVNVADHGLFAAGIVYSIVPRGTPVFLIRVLNDFGIGDSLAIGHALAALPRALLGTDQPGARQPRLVVNLSLGIDIPIPSRLFDRWLPETSRTGSDVAGRLPELCALFDHLHANISDVVGWLTERGVLVVAAAGNDALRRDVVAGEPPPPRYPARYDEVLGVAAVRRDLHMPAMYSNRGDVVLQTGSGHVATFGGNVVPAANDQSSATTSPNDSVVGIFSGTLPGGTANGTGWARWSGTSFSTPIVAGLAARLWGTDRSRTPVALAQYVRSFAHNLHPGTDPFSPLEVPVLHVAQT